MSASMIVFQIATSITTKIAHFYIIYGINNKKGRKKEPNKEVGAKSRLSEILLSDSRLFLLLNAPKKNNESCL